MTNEDIENAKIDQYIKSKLSSGDHHMDELNRQFEQDKKKLDSIVKTKIDTINSQMKLINKYSDKLRNGPPQIDNQGKLLSEKNNLINTRLLMLDNTRRKNSYKKKLVYTTISIILLIIIIMLGAYVYKNKQHKTKNFNKNVALK